MTRAQALAALQAATPLLATTLAGAGIVGLDGQENDVGQVMFRTPVGTVAAFVPILAVPPLTRAQARTQARAIEEARQTVLAPFEVDIGRGFNVSRGAIPSPGHRAGDGYV